MDNSILSKAAAIFAAGGAAIIIISIAVVVLLIIAWWKLFAKANGKGWQSLIPVYNEYKFVKITWSALAFWIGGIAIPAVLGILLGAINNSTAQTIIAIVSAVYILVFDIMLCNNVSKAYGHGAGFTIGLLFLPNLFLLILAFGKSQYVGPKGIKA